MLTTLENLDSQSLAAPNRRLRNAAAGFEALTSLLKDDEQASYDRANVNDMMDGAPPYDPELLRSLGQGQRTNLNFREAEAIQEASLVGYNDLNNSVDLLARVQTEGLPVDEKDDKEQAISEELHKTFWDWSDFDFNDQLIALKFVRHGWGADYWDNDLDWRWDVVGPEELLIPRDTRAKESAIEIAVCLRSIPVHRLFSYIRNPKAIPKGWNVKEVKMAILRAGNYDMAKNGWGRAWEQFQVDAKNNDLGVSISRASSVGVAHFYVKEWDGSVSHSIGLRDGTNTEWLYDSRGRFRAMKNFLVTYTYGVGNGYYHSLRGLGNRIHPHIQVSNRLQCQMVDGAMVASCLMLQTENRDDLDGLGVTYLGPYAILPPGVKIQTATMPDVGRTVLPVANSLSMALQNNTGTYHARATTTSGQERTKYEVQAQQAQEAVLSVGAMNLYYRPRQRTFEEAYRRLVNPTLKQSDPGGEAAFDFRKRCKVRGISLEDLRRVKRVVPTRAVGQGSAQMRLLALDDIEAMAGQFDEVGRSHALRDRVAARMGYAAVDRYVPRGRARPLVDTEIAELQNVALGVGAPVSVLSIDNHLVHSEVHLNALSQAIGGVNGGHGDPAAALPAIGRLIQHLGIHLGHLQSDPSRQEAAGALKHALQNYGGIYAKMAQHVQAQAARAQQQQAQGPQQGQGAPPPDPAAAAAMAKAQSDIQIAQAKAKNDMAIKSARAHQNLQIHAQTHQLKSSLADLSAASDLHSQAFDASNAAAAATDPGAATTAQQP